MKIRLIAFYLPQYHRIPENDRFWGKGFTEWTNVKKAKPLFKGHYQPHKPLLGYYNLLSAKLKNTQAEIAHKYGVEGFCYWHFWYSGNKVMARPLEQVLKTEKPYFPFSLAWANESWTGTWYGISDKILIKQSYPGRNDHIKHFYSLLPAFKDKRYQKVNGKLLFLIYRPLDIPNTKDFTILWNKLSKENGLKGFYFIGYGDRNWSPNKFGFDGKLLYEPIQPGFIFDKVLLALFKKQYFELKSSILKKPNVYLYKDMLKFTLPEIKDSNYFPTIIPNWDNTPRCHYRGFVFKDSTPELFKEQLKRAFSQIKNRKFDERIIFVKSWNEWGEGNYLEPEEKFGYEYLNVLKEETISIASKS